MCERERKEEIVVKEEKERGRAREIVAKEGERKRLRRN